MTCIVVGSDRSMSINNTFWLNSASGKPFETKIDSNSIESIPANQVHSTAQQVGARIGWNPIDAATQPPTGTRERVLNLSDPRTDHRNLGFDDSCLSGAPPSFSRRFGQVVDDGGNRFRSRHACRWMAH